MILAFLAAARRTGQQRYVAAAAHHGEHLLATAVRHPWGWAWNSDPDAPPLCGLAHGASGMAWALGELAATVPDERFTQTVLGARRYERSWFDSTTNSWPDLRPDVSPAGAPPLRPALWCHGAIGIGLSRLALYRLALYRLGADPSLAAESACALQAAGAAAAETLETGPYRGLTICHGIGGSVLLMLAANDTLGEPQHLAAARWVADQVLAQLGTDDAARWPSGVRDGGFSPGLMTGLAGTMYVLARAADPVGVGPITGLGG